MDFLHSLFQINNKSEAYEKCRRRVCSQEAEKRDELKLGIGAADRLSRGETAASVGRHYGVNESTLHYIKKKEQSEIADPRQDLDCVLFV